MKKIVNYISTSLVLLLVSSVITAQDVEFKAANFKDKKDEFKAAETSLKKGEEYLQLGNTAIYEIKDPGNNFKAALIVA